MHPALRCLSVVLSFTVASLSSTPTIYAASLTTADPVAEELLGMGPEGETIQLARGEVIAILSESNSCSAWFLSAEPEVVEKFRSLRFVVDPNGIGEIRKVEAQRDEPGYYQPYVARTGQNVGWGSTIALNAHGAFFRKDAPVRVVSQLDEPGYFASFRPLVVGGYPGATLQARILTMLHELGHIVNLLPVDAGVPSGPILSVHNTEQVLHYCGSQIRAHKKATRMIVVSASTTSPNAQPPRALLSKPPSRGRWMQ